MKLEEALASIGELDKVAEAAAWKRLDSIAKPLRSLGKLEELIAKSAGIFGSLYLDFSKKAVVVMCADNGVVEEGVTQAPQEVTAIVTENFAKGATSLCAMCRVAGVDVIPIDIGVARDVSPRVRNCKIRYGTANMRKTAAMSRAEAIQAIEVGINLVGELRQKGYTLIGTGEMGIGNTTSSSALAAVLLMQPVEVVTGRGAGLSSTALEKKIQVIKDALELHKPSKADVLSALAKVGGLDIAGLAGVFIGGAVYRIPVLIDGFISGVAALVAVNLEPKVQQFIFPSHVSKEPAGKLVLDALGLEPYYNCNMCLGEGTGTVLAMQLFECALAVYREMSTFTEIAITEYQPLS
ncbi:MAG: nicotinate-nucleotide--dimethylbenzimidazole phosphoribosyltransferase [Clostridia bacterium]